MQSVLWSVRSLKVVESTPTPLALCKECPSLHSLSEAETTDRGVFQNVALVAFASSCKAALIPLEGYCHTRHFFP